MRLYFYVVLTSLILSTTVDAETVYQTTEGFEELFVETDESGKEIDTYGFWFDGGSSAFTKTSERYSGDTSFSLAPLSLSGEGDSIVDGNYVDSTGEAKPYYGSFYTKTLDLSASSSVTLNFRYLLTNSSGDTSTHGYFAIEASNDGGESFSEIDVPDELSPIKSTESQWLADTKVSCTFLILPQAISACQTVALLDSVNLSNSDTEHFWSDEVSINIPSEYLTKHTVLRFKSYFDFDEEPKLKAYFDEVSIRYEGGEPTLSTLSVKPVSDELPSNAKLYNHATFDGTLTDGAVTDSSTHDWGIWTDGGRNAYLTGFLADGNVNGVNSGTNAGVALRWAYVEGALNEPAADGSSTGEHKSTYSSIITANTDFSDAESLAIEFSFVGYNLDISESEYFELSISTNSGIDFYSVKSWVVGEDFINLDRNKVTVIIPGDITEAGRLSQTTQLKFQTHGSVIEDQTYIDSIKVYTVGTGPGLAVADKQIDWDADSDKLTVVKANTAHIPTDASIHPAYDIINKALIKSDIYLDGAGDFEGKYGEVTDGTLPCIYGAVEHTDDSHPEFGPHITQQFDEALGVDVFVFHIHQDDHTASTVDGRAYPSPDTDRCRLDAEPGEDSYRTDRQRMEIKAFSESNDYQLAVEGETHYMSWLMKLPEGYGASDKFTHLHQLKPVGGDNAGMPTITLTPVAAKEAEDLGEVTTPAKLNLRYSPSTASQVTLTSIDLADIEGKWVRILEKVTYGDVNEGRYEFLIMDADDLDGEPLMSFASDSLVTWKGGDYVRAKWGVYRSIAQGDLVKDEEIGFADFVILESDDADAKLGDLIDFGLYASQSDNLVVLDNPLEWENKVDLDINYDIHVSQSEGLVNFDINGSVTVLQANSDRDLIIRSGNQDDNVVIDSNVEYKSLQIETGAGNDVIEGGDGTETIFAGPGDDQIFGGRGADDIYAGDGNDIIYGGRGWDNLFGEGGDDLIYGERGRDDIVGGEGLDVIFAGNGADTIEAELDGDIIFVENGNDTINDIEVENDPDGLTYPGNGGVDPIHLDEYSTPAETESRRLSTSEEGDPWTPPVHPQLPLDLVAAELLNLSKDDYDPGVFKAGNYIWFAKEAYSDTPQDLATFELKRAASDNRTWTLWQSSNNDSCVVGFRGTNSTNIGDLYRDGQALILTSIDDSVDSGIRGALGFVTRYKNTKDELRGAITSQACTSVRFTGHSLGAAVAQIAGFMYATDNPTFNVAVEAYNPPKAGNQNFADAYQLLVRSGHDLGVPNYFKSNSYARYGDWVSEIGRPGVPLVLDGLVQIDYTEWFTTVARGGVEDGLLSFSGAALKNHNIDLWEIDEDPLFDEIERVTIDYFTSNTDEFIVDNHPSRSYVIQLLLNEGIDLDTAEFFWAQLVFGLYQQFAQKDEDKSVGHYILAADFANALLQTPVDKSALWSGGIEMSDLAISLGYTTLESTPLGKIYTELVHNELLIQDSEWPNVFTPAANIFLENGQGEVNIFIRWWDQTSVLLHDEVDLLNTLLRQHRLHVVTRDSDSLKFITTPVDDLQAAYDLLLSLGHVTGGCEFDRCLASGDDD